MDKDHAARLLAKVGSALLRKPYPFHPTLLVAEVEAGRAAVSVYKEVGGDVVYVSPDNGDLLFHRLLALWAAWPSGERWWTIEYLLRDGHSVAYCRCTEHDWATDAARAQAVVRCFGNRPVVCPPRVTVGGAVARS